MAERRVVRIDGERDGLWWEFALSASFRWEGYVNRMGPTRYRQRLAMLTRELGLTRLLDKPVSHLTPGQRALANLALGLLTGPEVLIYKAPFAQMAGPERERAVRLIRRLMHSEGLSVVWVGASAIPVEPRPRPALRLVDPIFEVRKTEAVAVGYGRAAQAMRISPTEMNQAVGNVAQLNRRRPG